MSILKKIKLNTPDDEDVNDDTKTMTKDNQLLPVNIEPISNELSIFILKLETNLTTQLQDIKFKSPVECVYNPLQYAYNTHEMFVKKYCHTTKKILFLGLNPGPWGMAQTGVPFGEVKLTRDWLNINGYVKKPENEISTRPISGFYCTRSEVSGKRFWSFFQNVCGTPDNFFKHSFIYNYCPLLFMKESGINVTPADVKNSEAVQLLKVCDETLLELIKILKVEIIIGIGRYAEKRAKDVVKNNSLSNIKVHFLIHPSPRIPKNENWDSKAKQTLIDLDLLKYFTP